MLSTVEAALAAWAESEPDGYTLPEVCVPALLPATAARLPRSSSSSSCPSASEENQESSTPCFAATGFARRLQLHARDGHVHFLYYWRAFDEAARLAMRSCSPDSEGDIVETSGTLTAEIEVVRDKLLDAIRDDSQTLGIASLVEMIYSIAERSVAPPFWRTVGCSMTYEKSMEISLDELTVVLLSWLHDAVMWQLDSVAPLLQSEQQAEIADSGAADLVPVAMQTQMCSDPNFRTAMLSKEDTFIEVQGTTSQRRRFSRTAMVFLDEEASPRRRYSDDFQRSESSPARLRRSASPSSPARADAFSKDLGLHPPPPSSEVHMPCPPFASPPKMDLEAESPTQDDNHFNRTLLPGMLSSPGKVSTASESLRALLQANLSPGNLSTDTQLGSLSGSLDEFVVPPRTCDTSLPDSPMAGLEKSNAGYRQSTRSRRGLFLQSSSVNSIPEKMHSHKSVGSTAHLAPPPNSFATQAAGLQLLADASNEQLPSMKLPHHTDQGSNGMLRTAMIPCSPGSVLEQQKLRKAHPEQSGFAVLLHIYDVSQEQSIQHLNRVLAHRLSPLKFGGVFHAGVEVNGLEWAFGETDVNEEGVTSGTPKTHPDHHFRQSIPRGYTRMSEDEIIATIMEMQEQYPGPSYDLLRRNCCHFADDLCQRLGVGKIPAWVHRLARMGARIDNVLGVHQRVKSRDGSRRERLVSGSRSRGV